jgi:excisionase family DNA binding protein
MLHIINKLYIMQPLTFEQLPGAVTELSKKTEWIISALLQLIDKNPKINERKTAPEAARYLKIALPTLYAYTSQRKIKHIKSGKNLQFLESDLDEFLESGRRKTADELADDMRRTPKRRVMS